MGGQVKYLRNGREVSLLEFVEGIKGDLYQLVANKLEAKISSIECPDHHESPTVYMTEAQDGNLTFEIRGCCDAIKQQVHAAMI